MTNQLVMFPPLEDWEDEKEIERQFEVAVEYGKKKRNWEDAFQRWSDSQVLDGTSSLGVCGYGYMCDWCNDNSYGRPCVRALNAMCREKGLRIDYDKRDFEDVWEKGV